MTLRDGTKLAANVYKPAGKGPWPVILSRTPYLKDGRATDETPDPGPGLAKQAKRYTDAGYVFVLQDVRGKGRSEGFYAAFENDIEDGYDAVEWVAAQPWSNGKVGMTGGSALGITANSAAMANPPHLVTAYVVVAPADRLTYSYPGGVLKDKDTIGWLSQQGASEAQLDQVRRRALDDVSWNRVAMTTNRRYIDIPIFNVGGWYDIFNGGTVENFEWLQNHGAKGARGCPEADDGPLRPRPALRRPGVPRRPGADGRRPGDPLVRLLAEGPGQRDHGRAAGQLLHDGLGEEGGAVAQEPAAHLGQLAARQPPRPLLPHRRQGPDDHGSDRRRGEDRLPVRPREARADLRRRQPHLRARPHGPACGRPAAGLSALPDPGAREGRRHRRPGFRGALGRHRRAGHRLHGQAGGRLSRRLRGPRPRRPPSAPATATAACRTR
nr:CocE/NonD family hydrolase [Phenylobacterium sp. J367]